MGSGAQNGFSVAGTLNGTHGTAQRCGDLAALRLPVRWLSLPFAYTLSSLLQLKADWGSMTGVELYDYRTVDMTDFDQFDRVNVAGQPSHAAAQKELATVLHAHFNNM